MLHGLVFGEQVRYVARTQGGMGFAHILGKHLSDFVAKFKIAPTAEALLGFLRQIMAMISEGLNVVEIIFEGARTIYIVRVGNVLVRVVTENGEIMSIRWEGSELCLNCSGKTTELCYADRSE